MDTGEALDREVIVERAEELKTWLSGLGLSGRTFSALDRELSGIIANDPGSYINGQRPLAGFTIDDFIVALHSRGAGAIGQVKSIGEAALRELRGTIEPNVPVAAPAAAPPPEPELELPELELPELELPELEPLEVAPPAPRRPGRPKGSTNAAKKNGAVPQPQPVAVAPQPAAGTPEAPAKRPRGRPRKVVEPASVAAAPAPKGRRGRPPGSTRPAQPRPAPKAVASAAPPAPPTPAKASPGADMALDQLVRLWPSLHPHARRAIVLYASDLLAEPAE